MLRRAKDKDHCRGAATVLNENQSTQIIPQMVPTTAPQTAPQTAAQTAPKQPQDSPKTARSGPIY